ncbi:MAG: hypothetical protein DHS20C18_36090 [Saprospiraceae bacterium]|nr:MAG: hypothetical protein DHS20C18_36090 [Saprospiraceae bacterium]
MGHDSSIFDLIQSDEILEMTIVTDLRELIENRRLDDYLPAIISWESKNIEKEQFSIKVKPRGKYRRKICPFPPLKLNFSKGDLKERNLAKFDKLKLVTHCIDDKLESKQNVLKEYLAYKMYNELTPNSFRVQLVYITYQDSKNVFAKRKRYGFIIEDNDQLAERMNGTVCDCLNPEKEKVQEYHESLVGFFQFMIGNEDWDMAMGRNLELITNKENGEIIPVPYDFDFSGFVNPAYALPNSDHEMTSVTDRYYLGLVTDNNRIGETYEYYKSKRSNLEAILASFSPFNQRKRKKMLAYLNSFYTDMEEIIARKDENWFVLMKEAGRSVEPHVPVLQVSINQVVK